MITTRAVSAPLPRPHVAAAQRPLNATLPTPWPGGLVVTVAPWSSRCRVPVSCAPVRRRHG